MGDASGEDLIAQLLTAISNTEEWQFIRMLMNERMPAGEAGGEAASEETPVPATVDPEDDYREKMSAYQRLGRFDPSPVLSYQLPRETDAAELYQRRREAHGEACQAFDTFVESRKGVADRAAEYALAHTCSYSEALTALGESLPNVSLLPAHVA